MHTSLNWMNSHLSSPSTPDRVEQVLTAAGFEVDDVVDQGNDTLFDIEVTSNRTDCLSHIGMAREVAAASERTLLLPEFTLRKSENAEDVNTLTSVENRELELCPRYTARVIQGVKIAPSPAWLVERIESIGLRPINNVVDITNFVLHETGQPLHTFDYNKLDGKKIIIRKAEEGESFVAIDGTTHKLSAGMLVIADATSPVAVAGVMGGKESEVTDETTDILLESARFDPLSVRATSRKLKLSSDSSYRFERKVDPAGSDYASERAAELILELAGGKLADGVIVAGEALPGASELTMRVSRCNQIMGIDIPVEEMLGYFEKLELQPRHSGDVITCTIPTFRLDLTREIDLVEEVARLHGMDDDQLPVEPKMSLVVKRPQAMILARKAINHVLTANGFFETITFSNVSEKHVQPFKGDLEIVELNRDQKKSDPALRTSLLPSLLETRKHNQDAGNKYVRLFEVAKIFGKQNGKYVERKKLGLLLDAGDADTGLRDTKGVLNALLRDMGLLGQVQYVVQDNHEWAAPAANIVLGDQVIGQFGLATKAVQDLFDLQQGVVLAELDYVALTGEYPPQPAVKTLPKFPTIERDLSVIVNEDTSWANIESVITSTQPELMEQLEFVTVYRGKQVGAGKKSVTFRMCYRHPERTLQHDEVDPQVKVIIDQLQAKLQGEIRA